jgi:hypothetical protein
MFDFLSFAFGFLAASFLGFVAQRLLQLQGVRHRPDQTMNAFPATLQPVLTPNSVVEAAWAAYLSRLFWKSLFVIVFFGTIYLLWVWISNGGAAFGLTQCS